MLFVVVLLQVLVVLVLIPFVAFVLGRWHRFAKSGFRKPPADGLDAQMPALLA